MHQGSVKGSLFMSALWPWEYVPSIQRARLFPVPWLNSFVLDWTSFPLPRASCEMAYIGVQGNTITSLTHVSPFITSFPSSQNVTYTYFKRNGRGNCSLWRRKDTERKVRSFRNFPRKKAEYQGNLKLGKQTETSKFLRDMFKVRPRTWGSHGGYRAPPNWIQISFKSLISCVRLANYMRSMDLSFLICEMRTQIFHLIQIEATRFTQCLDSETLIRNVYSCHRTVQHCILHNFGDTVVPSGIQFQRHTAFYDT